MYLTQIGSRGQQTPKVFSRKIERLFIRNASVEARLRYLHTPGTFREYVFNANWQSRSADSEGF